MFARLTTDEPPYSWVTVFPVPGGGWTEGGIKGDAAYEINGRKPKAGTVVDLVPAGQEYRFKA